MRYPSLSELTVVRRKYSENEARSLDSWLTGARDRPATEHYTDHDGTDAASVSKRERACGGLVCFAWSASAISIRPSAMS